MAKAVKVRVEKEERVQNLTTVALKDVSPTRAAVAKARVVAKARARVEERRAKAAARAVDVVNELTMGVQCRMARKIANKTNEPAHFFLHGSTLCCSHGQNPWILSSSISKPSRASRRSVPTFLINIKPS